MKGPDKKALDIVEQAWTSLDAATHESGAQAQRAARFWQRFDQELGQEEAARQQRANQRTALEPISTTPPPLGAEEVLQLLDQDIDIPSYTDDHKQRFWQRFDRELAQEERHRQLSSNTPEHQPERHWLVLWRSLFWQHQRLTAAVCTCALMVVLASWGLQDAPVTITMRSTNPSQHAGQSATQVTQHAPQRTFVPPHRQQPKELFKHLPMLQHMAMFEQMDMLQQSPTLRDPKGS